MTDAEQIEMLYRALKRARPWLSMIAGEKGRPETSDIHAVLIEVDYALHHTKARP